MPMLRLSMLRLSRVTREKNLRWDSIEKYCSNLENKKLLDCGYLNGYFHERFLTKNIDVISIDINKDNIKLNHKIIISDVEKGLCFRNESFDIVWAGEFIEHIKNIDLLMKEFRRVLKPDGELWLSTPNLNSFYNRVLLLFGYPVLYSPMLNIDFPNMFTHEDHCRMFNKKLLEIFISSYNFEILEITTDKVNIPIIGRYITIKKPVSLGATLILRSIKKSNLVNINEKIV